MSTIQTTQTPSARTATAERLEQRPTVAPPVDIYENAQEILVVADVPGVSTDGLTIGVDGDQLVLEARRSGSSQGAPLAIEQRHTDYKRTFVLPRGIDPARIAAELSNGVLRLRLPKAEAVRPRKIPVTTS